MRRLSRKTSIVVIIVVLLIALAVLFARTRPRMHRFTLRSYVQHTSVPHIRPPLANVGEI
jgi:hypothetical protein